VFGFRRLHRQFPCEEKLLRVLGTPKFESYGGLDATTGERQISFTTKGFDIVEVVIKCKTLPRWFAGTSALDGGCCEQKVSRYCRYVYQYGKIGPCKDPDLKKKMRKWVYGYRSQYKTVKEVL
jgi:hypothetical protein